MEWLHNLLDGYFIPSSTTLDKYKKGEIDGYTDPTHDGKYHYSLGTYKFIKGGLTKSGTEKDRQEAIEKEELKKIVLRSADILGIGIEDSGASEIASRSRGTPRIANRMLKRVRDYAQVKADGVITSKVADEALSLLEVDKLGLDSLDRRMLRAIIEYYNGGPVGLETLAATINEEAVTLEDVYEPYLLQSGFIIRTPRGRCVTRNAYEHLGLKYSGGNSDQTVLDL